MPVAPKRSSTTRHRTSQRPGARTTAPTAAAPIPRTNDPDRTVADILAVATAEFAEKGFSGARIDEIAERMATSKRTIYYYFGGKEALYLAVLEEAYRRIRSLEHAIDIDHLEPEEALRQLVGFTFDYQNANPDFVRLVMNENILKAAFLRQSKEIQRLNIPAIAAVRSIYERGVASGAFRPGLDPVDLHMTISALSFFNVANRHTFGVIFKHDMGAPESLATRRANVIEALVRYVRA
jgi:AcrR family transcriptional regulator